MRRLSSLRVVVFGVGGVGSWCAEALLRTGVAHISLVDPDAVAASRENAAKNGVEAEFFRHALGGRGQGPLESADLVVANILGPLLIRFADEIVPCVKRHLVVSGILNELYGDVAAAYRARSLAEVSHKTIGEWTTGLFEVVV